MNLKKRCKVVLVSSEKGNLFYTNEFIKGTSNLKLGYSEFGVVENILHQIHPLSMCIISDDKVEVGNLAYLSLEEDIVRVRSLVGAKIEESLKKIISSTDILLTISGYTGVVDESNGEKEFCKEQLPTPSFQFIQKFISEYNKGNIISEVDVEYEEGYYTFNGQMICTLFKEIKEIKGRQDIFTYPTSDSTQTFTAYGFKGQLLCKNEKMENLVQHYTPKVDKENNISIFKIKDSWNREEVMKLIEDAIMTTYQIPFNDKNRPIVISKWIEENL